MKILVVDDEIDILELLPRILHAAGFPDVTTAQSGEAALELVDGAETAFDCFCIDINMAEMHGIDLCRQIRDRPVYRDRPIIMLTAMADKDHIDRAFQAGATDYATKPFDFMDLSARLRSAEELVLARKAAAANKLDRVPLNEGPGRGMVYLSDPERIEGVEDLVDYSALGNYLGQLSRAGVLSSQVIAVTIDRIDALFARSSSDEVIYALVEVASAVRDAFRIYGCLMAYAGAGTFVVIAHNPNLLQSVEIETEIQTQLDDRNAEFDNGDAMDLEISVGNAIRPNPCMTQWFHRIFERAIVRAGNRADSKAKARAPFGLRLVGR